MATVEIRAKLPGALAERFDAAFVRQSIPEVVPTSLGELIVIPELRKVLSIFAIGNVEVQSRDFTDGTGATAAHTPW